MRGSLEVLENRVLLAQSPQLLFSLAFDPTNATGSSAMSEVFQLDDQFVAVEAISDDSFSIRTANASGDREVYQPQPGVRGRPDDVVVLNDQLYLFFDATFNFGGGGPGQQVWKFDPEAGLTRASNISSLGTRGQSVAGRQNPFQFTFGDHLYFTADADVARNEEFEHTPGNFGLWRTDGTEEGTTPLLDLIPGFQRATSSAVVNDRLLLNVNTETGAGLWAFDETLEGTQEILPGRATIPVAAGGNAYFTIDTELGRELHVSDGTLEGTRLVADLNEDPSSSGIGNLLPYQDGLSFTAETDSVRGLWFTDGTLAGTKKLFSGSVVDVEVAGQLYFTTDDGKLYRSTDSGVVEVFSSLDAIDLLGATDDMLLFESGNQTYTVGSQHESLSPNSFAAPGPFRFATRNHFVFATKEVRAESIEAMPTPATSFSVQPWVSDGTDRSTTKLGEPAIHRDVPGFVDLDTHRILGMQQLDGYLALRIYNFVLETDIVSISAFAYEFSDAPPFMQGDANEDGNVDFADFLILSANFGRTDAVWADGDFDASGEVDFADFVLLSNNFGKLA